MPRPAGLPKTGGRKKGTLNKATAARQAAIVASGMTPLDFMLSIMRDEGAATELRLEAACKAAPFVHPRLSAVAVENKDGEPFAISVEQQEREAEERARKALAIIDETFGLAVADGTAGHP